MYTNEYQDLVGTAAVYFEKNVKSRTTRDQGIVLSDKNNSSGRLLRGMVGQALLQAFLNPYSASAHNGTKRQSGSYTPSNAQKQKSSQEASTTTIKPQQNQAPLLPSPPAASSCSSRILTPRTASASGATPVRARANAMAVPDPIISMPPAPVRQKEHADLSHGVRIHSSGLSIQTKQHERSRPLGCWYHMAMVRRGALC